MSDTDPARDTDARRDSPTSADGRYQTLSTREKRARARARFSLVAQNGGDAASAGADGSAADSSSAAAAAVPAFGRVEEEDAWARAYNLLQAPHANRHFTIFFLWFAVSAQIGLFIGLMALNDWRLVDLYENPLLGPGVDALRTLG